MARSLAERKTSRFTKRALVQIADRAVAFQRATLGLRIKTPFFRCLRWLRLDPMFYRRRCLRNKFGKARSGIFTISLLRPEPFSANDQNALVRHATPGKQSQPAPYCIA